jgi:putative aldouronate transport system permease protein
MKQKMKKDDRVIGSVEGHDEKIFDFLTVILGILIIVASLYPVYYALIASMSRPFGVDAGEVMFTVKSFTLASYKTIFGKSVVWIAYGNTFFYTIVGVLVNMALSTTLAYALSKKGLVLKKTLTLVAIFTMWFNAGLIPRYMNIRALHLLNTRSAIIWGTAIYTYNMIILKSFFEQVPSSLEESAFIDGANNFQTFFKIYLPISKPALATVGLFYAIGRWNAYFWAMTLLKDDELIPLQVLLKKLIVDRVSNANDAALVTKASMTSPTTEIYAMIIIAIIPMLIVFPFVQKYFKKGLTMGSVKG